VQVGRVDVDEQRAQLSDRAPRLVRRGPHRLLHDRRAVAVELARGGRERVRDAREVLDGAVVEVARDAAPLEVGRGDRAAEQPLALLLRDADPPREPPRERKLHEVEQEQRHEQRGEEGAPEVAPARGHGREGQVRLEQERLAGGGLHRHVDLEQLAAPALEAVLGRVEVAHLGVDAAAAERVEVVGVEPVAGADQARLVGVDDAAVGRPQLQPDQPVAEDAGADDPVEPCDRVRVAVDDPGGHVRPHDAAAGERRLLLRVADRLVRARALEQLDADDPEQDDGGERAQRELEDCSLHASAHYPSTRKPDGTAVALSHHDRGSRVPTAIGLWS
jgi:hypothetical protein